MANMVKPNPEELVRAFREAARKLGCDKSEQRFEEALYAIGYTESRRRAQASGATLKATVENRTARNHVTQKRGVGLEAMKMPRRPWTENEL